MIILDPRVPCTERCNEFWRRYYKPVTRDFNYSGDDPAVINLTEYKDTEDYISKISYSKRYGAKRAVAKGYLVEQFNFSSFIGDIVEINTSKEVRSGGPMRKAYLETVEQRGGYLKAFKPPPPVLCYKHSYIDFGIFRYEPGRMQGDVVVDKRLYGYIGLICLGDYSLFSMIIGHGDFLKDDIMPLLAIEVIRYLKENTEAKYLEYGQEKSGAVGLQMWKKMMLFKPTKLIWTIGKEPELPT